jgi:hypothetical protein
MAYLTGETLGVGVTLCGTVASHPRGTEAQVALIKKAVYEFPSATTVSERSQRQTPPCKNTPPTTITIQNIGGLMSEGGFQRVLPARIHTVYIWHIQQGGVPGNARGRFVRHPFNAGLYP